MTPKKLLKNILPVMIAMVLLTIACATTSQTPAPSSLEVTSVYPLTAVDQGHIFDIRVSLANQGSYNVHVSEIRLPASFLQNASYKGSDPGLNFNQVENGDGVFAMDMTIAPNGLEEIIFRFEAISSGTLSGQGTVTTDDKAYQFQMTATVAGVNPGGWDPGVSPATAPVSLGPIPYQAVVKIEAVVDIDGQHMIGWSGSGTLISSDGLILTNAHVVLSDRFYQVQDLIVSLTVAQDSPPVQTYYASIVQADAAMDIAIIKPRTDLQGNPLVYSALNLPFVPFGDSDGLQLGDQIVILGYPGIGGDTITLTRGEVSGFTAEDPYGNRAFIKTSATIAGGNSGGLAVNDRGELIGVPTQVGSGDMEGSVVDCRALVDTNRDGYIDDFDTCVPTGGFINALRPVKLAQPMIAAAASGNVAIQADATSGEAFEAAGVVIFEDDFSDPNTGWSIDDSGAGITAYENGEYTIEMLEPSYWVWSDMDFPYDNLIVQVDSRVVNPVGDSDFGIICGLQDNQHFTMMEISEDGYFTIWKQNGADYLDLVKWTYASEVAAGGPFHISAKCGTDGLLLAVNGVILAEVPDPDFVPGSLGLVAGSFDLTGFKVAFDNFKLLLP